MAFTNKTGDRPNFPVSNERLDKPDLVAIADSLNETLVRTIGALLGPSSGALSPVTFDYSTPGAVSITNRCFFAYAWPSTPDDFGTMQGGVVICDPARESMTNANIDLDNAVANQAAWVWFTRTEVQTHTATRRKWAAGAEATDSPNTLMEEGITFWATTTTAHPNINEANGYFKFGAVAAANWTAGAPNSIRVINFPDGGFTSTAYLTDGAITEFGPGNMFLGGQNTGIALQLRWVFAKLSQIMDTDNTFDAASKPSATGAVGWASDPTMGLSQVQSEFVGINAELAAHEASLATLALRATRVLFSGYFTSDGITVIKSTGDYPGGVVSAVSSPTELTITFSQPISTATGNVFPLFSWVPSTGNAYGVGGFVGGFTSTTTLLIRGYSVDGSPFTMGGLVQEGNLTITGTTGGLY